MREYELFSSTGSGRDLTCYSRRYSVSPATTRTVWTVRARSVKQAYYLAGNEMWAEGPEAVGLLRKDEGADPEAVTVAPYLEAEDDD